MLLHTLDACNVCKYKGEKGYLEAHLNIPFVPFLSLFDNIYVAFT